MVYRLLSNSYIIGIANSSCLRHDIEDSRSNRDGDTVLAGTLVRGISRKLTRRRNAINDGDAIFVVRWILVTPVANLDITI